AEVWIHLHSCGAQKTMQGHLRTSRQIRYARWLRRARRRNRREPGFGTLGRNHCSLGEVPNLFLSSESLVRNPELGCRQKRQPLCEWQQPAQRIVLAQEKPV